MTKKKSVDIPEEVQEVINLAIKGEATRKKVPTEKLIILQMITESPLFIKYNKERERELK